MGDLLSAPGSFVANTRAKSSEVNARFNELYSGFRDGSKDPYTNGYRQSRTSLNSVTLTGSDCIMVGNFIIAAGHTYDLATSTARLVAFDDLQILTTGVLHIASGASARIV